MVTHEFDYPDLAYALGKGGEPITHDEPIGDAMRWQPTSSNPPGWPSPRPTRCPCPTCTATRKATT